MQFCTISTTIYLNNLSNCSIYFMHFEISRDFLFHISDLDALPINKKLTYEILDSNVFTIDTDSGIVRLAQELDREIQALYNLTIRATDQGRPRRLSQTSNLVILSFFFPKGKMEKNRSKRINFTKKVVYTIKCQWHTGQLILFERTRSPR